MTASPKLKLAPNQQERGKISAKSAPGKSVPLLRLLEETNPCWLCGCREARIIRANDDQSSRLRFAPTLKASKRCSGCDCFLGVVGGES